MPSIRTKRRRAMWSVTAPQWFQSAPRAASSQLSAAKSSN